MADRMSWHREAAVVVGSGEAKEVLVAWVVAGRGVPVRCRRARKGVCCAWGTDAEGHPPQEQLRAQQRVLEHVGPAVLPRGQRGGHVRQQARDPRVHVPGREGACSGEGRVVRTHGGRFTTRCLQRATSCALRQGCMLPRRHIYSERATAEFKRGRAVRRPAQTVLSPSLPHPTRYEQLVCGAGGVELRDALVQAQRPDGVAHHHARLGHDGGDDERGQRRGAALADLHEPKGVRRVDS